MARRLGAVLCIAAVLLLAAAACVRATGQQATQGPGPKEKPKPMSVKCQEKRKVNPSCFNRNMSCPASCPQSCYADCDTCKLVCVSSVPGACGDPRFIGGDGNAFYFHGRRNVVSDRDLHINAHFIGKRSATGMSRDFTDKCVCLVV